MRKYLYILLLSLSASGLYAQTSSSRMTTAIDIGTYSDFFNYSDSKNTVNFTDGYNRHFFDEGTNQYYTQPSARDIFYKVTITNKSMQLLIDAYGSSFLYGTRIYILDEDGSEIAYCRPYDLAYPPFIHSVQPGTYYIVVEAATDTYAPQDAGVIALGIEAIAKPVGDDFFYPALLGTFQTNFNITHTPETYMMDYVCDIKNGSAIDNHINRRDMVHKFTISKRMEVVVDNVGSNRIESTQPYDMHLLSSSMDKVQEESIETIGATTKKLHYDLPPGTYYVYSKFTMNTYTDGIYLINVTGKEPLIGSSATLPIDVGSKTSTFTYSHTQNTALFSKNWYGEKSGKEVFYKFSITVPMEISLDNCGSAVTDTYLRILSEEQQLAENDTYTGTGACGNTQQAYIKVPVLLPGTYYIVSDGEQDGNMTTTIRGTTIGPMGDKLVTAIDVGTHDAGFYFSDTQNTASTFSNQFPAKPSNDVFYKFKLTKAMDVVLSHCGSVLSDTYMSILDANGTVIYSNDNYTGEGNCGSTGNALIKIPQMPIGTYYLVSEGNSQNGSITTRIEAKSGFGNLNTTSGQPHIISIIPNVQTDSLEMLEGDQLGRSVQYFDRFGNPSVSIALDAVPLGGDQVTLQETDGFLRKSKDWLPVAKTTNGGQYPNPLEVQAQAKTTTLYGGDQRPYHQTFYDGSALNIVTEQYGPGNDWFVNNRSQKTVRTTNYGTFGELACARYAVSGTYAAPTLVKNGFYNNYELHVTKTIDEDNHISYEFKDKAGRTILSRKMNGSIAHDTYYVHDHYGNLNFVLPPLASDALIADNVNWSESTTAIAQYAYVYKYDGNNRSIFKKLPGCEPTYYVYDEADRMIFSQDGVQRAKPTPEWTFYIPDVFGRIVLTGICTNSVNYQAAPFGNVLVKATYTGGTNAFKGYSVSNVSLSSPTILTVNYYDDYAFLNTNGVNDAGYIAFGQTDLELHTYSDTQVEASGSITLKDGFHVPAGSNFQAMITGGSSSHLSGVNFGTRASSVKGLQTGTLTAQISPGGVVETNYLHSAIYYDNRGRVIQIADKVPGGTRRIATSYDFAGKPLFILENQSVQGLQTEILTAYTYDRSGRQLTEKVSVNGVDQTSVASSYDQIGRLAATTLAKGSWSNTETMKYNIRGWLTEKLSPVFSMQLKYKDVISATSDKFYGGNISEWTWQHGSGTNNMYSFKYDGLSRLTGAHQYISNGVNWTDATNHYTEKEISYDKQGNILTLQRSAGGSIVDNLSYAYDGNRLSALNESITSPGTLDMLVRGSSSQGTYNYNQNGNMVYDSRKNLTYGHNFLNLTDVVKEGQTVKASYKWSALGTKLSVRDGAGSNGFNYVGSMVYSYNNNLTDVEAIQFSHGVIRKQANGYMVNYFLKDHLGNNRIVLDGNGAVLEKNDYYPFGAGHKRSDYLASDNRYKYNGKEEQVVGNLGLLDYGARFYDPVIARWTTPDPLAEKSRRWSPYNYAENNPVRFIDPDGMEKEDPQKRVNTTVTSTEDKSGKLHVTQSTTTTTVVKTETGSITTKTTTTATDIISNSETEATVHGDVTSRTSVTTVDGDKTTTTFGNATTVSRADSKSDVSALNNATSALEGFRNEHHMQFNDYVNKEGSSALGLSLSGGAAPFAGTGMTALSKWFPTLARALGLAGAPTSITPGAAEKVFKAVGALKGPKIIFVSSNGQVISNMLPKR